ncbi:MAG: dihydrodipicolinate synthase family protein, partial [Clostridia bacterium]|nr:dihydrodipicolinate synthase family protein [Clostridia bacterium]
MALFEGCGTALITPFRNDEVDYDALDRLVEEQIEAGVDALIAAGTTGEPATMTWEEHLNVIR